MSACQPIEQFEKVSIVAQERLICGLLSPGHWENPLEFRALSLIDTPGQMDNRLPKKISGGFL
jgi:hypothetical protein